MTVLNGEDEVVGLCRDLIRIDSTNAGDNSGPGERAAAEYVAGKLAEVGLEPKILESDSRRANVIARIEGEDPSRGALLLHGHLDVVPFDAGDWTRHPLSGEVADGCVWGRGAVDMKDMDAMILAVVRQRLSQGRRPPRDVVLAFTADEEAGGEYGAQWLADKHGDLFEGCTEAIGEVGGFSVSVDEARRLYLIEAAEKGIAWMRLTATGRAGHGSMLNSENAVTELAEAVGRIGRHEWPVRLTRTVRTFLEETSRALEIEFDPEDAEKTVAKLGPLARMIGATLRNTANPTMLQSGYKANVIPQTATAHVDGRFLPGYEEEFFATIDELLGPNVTREFVYHDIAVETGFEGSLVRAMTDSLLAEDPGALAVPYTLSGGTDLKAFSRLGIRGFGFAPLKLPADLDFSGMFHGIDERVPVDSLRFGVRVLDRFLDAC
ncbi:acetylornithine deacetylase/succinyl-diaminopimelate desuccinylase-like protein [Streptosporangium becharense]|uniref:Acetylornithine deacetylase/succinyl-diaminopimelate desuccinylase-like protein n=1 Tax=Streptosporangium becharense TaxID=1816182 RepID=A0A7W9MHK3_9ACTN|nr:M20/M25/M40 family metallo-hydrolase [Streptosporangium becharense]MBB2912612.1 acetylornithine deacetylase/succinyl-diaminopimelate desuccinylase-like protein [Streptosporangium becharense]MBB5820558.1 acetylornithine deacetylase/succinyl-diaminopimelate desuccinylase-like protein [Streptosporangium becharense]